MSAKFCKKAAMAAMMIMDGKTTPSVARIPPNMPASVYPTKVAVFTAMMPGVHWPTA